MRVPRAGVRVMRRRAICGGYLAERHGAGAPACRAACRELSSPGGRAGYYCDFFLYLAMIEFQHVFKSYGRGRNILADINFRISAGEFVFCPGVGAGKSTLLKLIGGLSRCRADPSRSTTSGWTDCPAGARPYLRRAGVILQDTHLLYDRSAFQNVMRPGGDRPGPGLGSRRSRPRRPDKVGLAGKEDLNLIELSAANSSAWRSPAPSSTGWPS